MGLEAHMIHQTDIKTDWKEDSVPPFDELMISWNATRPINGKYLIYVKVKVDDWSPWLLYASWGSDGQASYLSTTAEAPVRVYQDAVAVTGSHKGTGFQIRVVPEGNAQLDQIRAIHVYTNSDQTQEPQQTLSYSEKVYLQVNGLSQMGLNHMRHKDLCSPTCTTAVVQYLLQNQQIDPVQFALHSWDGGFDIFGNWVFNVAQASTELGPKWDCWVDRLSGFDEIYQRLHQGTPVIVSVRSPLPGSAQNYPKGHLITVIGFDPAQQAVICMDPAFPLNPLTHVHYALSDFLQAWGRRGRVAYVFSAK